LITVPNHQAGIRFREFSALCEPRHYLHFPGNTAHGKRCEALLDIRLSKQ
jgi:hypothetical protein